MSWRDWRNRLRGQDGTWAERRRVAADHRRIAAARGGSPTRMDRTATPEDLEQLRWFVQQRPRDVELFIEPATAATDTTVIAVGGDGQWTRRRVGGPAVAQALGHELAVPVYDVTRVGYPPAMRRNRQR